MIKQMGPGMLKACNGELVELYRRKPGYIYHRSDIFHDMAAVPSIPTLIYLFLIYTK